MAITTDILESYRRPRAVLRRYLEDGGHEARALAVLMGACLLMFVAQLPGLAREAHFEPEVPLDARMGGALMAMIFMVPLLAYALAAVSHGVALLFGGKGTFLSARMALFWSMLAISPLMLFHGLVRGMVGPGPSLTLTGIAVLAVFLVLWANALIEAERA
jgi:hypothetical protein